MYSGRSFALLLFTGCCLAQFETASVLGTVRDPSGAVIAGARITLRNVNTGITANSKTDSAGNYEFLILVQYFEHRSTVHFRQ